MKYILYFLFILFCNNVLSQTISYGSFTDTRDNKQYKTVTIDDQTWMTENLSFKIKEGCWAYEYDNYNVKQYGYLYSWQSANNVCPNGWHLPSADEYEVLLKKYGTTEKVFYKALMPKGWSGFNAQFGGYREPTGNFRGNVVAGKYWTSEVVKEDKDYSWSLQLNSYFKEASITDYLKTLGFSVRCIKNK